MEWQRLTPLPLQLPVLHEELLVGPDGGLSQPLRSLFEEHAYNPSFEVAADAFETISVCLTTNKQLVFRTFDPTRDAASLAQCVARGGGGLWDAEAAPSPTPTPPHPRSYNELMEMYSRLLASDNYVLKRQSLKLLSEFLLDRENFRIMMKYISDKSNLKVVMLMLRHKQANIQFEAFHVFKVFVANPEKPREVLEILEANRDKLIAFLQGFQNDKDDEQFAEEKAMLISTLQKLPTTTPVSTPSVTAS